MTLSIHGEIGRGGFCRAVDLDVAQGEVVGITGHNGAGKTTLLHTVAGIHRMLSGTLSLDGQLLDGSGEYVDPTRRRCVVVFQDFRLFPHMTVLGNVAYGPRSHGAPKAEARDRADAALESVGAAHLARRTPGNLSGGEKQRVALARALVTNPRVLLLDEPFAAVDAASRPGLRETLSKVLAASAAPALIVSHDPADIEGLATRSVTLG